LLYLPLLLGPLLGQSTKIESSADDELTLAQDLGLPAVRVAVKAELATPRHVIVPEAPEKLVKCSAAVELIRR
jgi:hypothetical protein